MAVDISVQLVISGLGDAVAGLFPGVNIYVDASQQGVGKVLPCFFLRAVPGKICKQVGNRWRREIVLAIDYLDEYNLPDLNDRYLAVAETLDMRLETFVVNGATIRAVDRTWSIRADMLSYQFTVKPFVFLAVAPAAKMETLEGVQINGSS